MSPETWLGNIQRAMCAACGGAGWCYMPDNCPNPERPPGRTGYGYCNGCGRPHGPGECLRGDPVSADDVCFQCEHPRGWHYDAVNARDESDRATGCLVCTNERFCACRVFTDHPDRITTTGEQQQ